MTLRPSLQKAEGWGQEGKLDQRVGRYMGNQAEEDSIRVFVDGVLNHDWYYQESDNTVYFTIIPTAGSLVEIGYRYIELDTGTVDSGS